MFDLSVVVPARNEEWLGRTVEDVLEHSSENTEIIVVLDGYTTRVPDLPQSSRLRVLKNEIAVGQRAATNQGVKASEAKYVAKLDAHCSMSQGFDIAMMADMKDDVTMIPAVGNLHVYDHICLEGHRHFQGKYEKCDQCGSTELHKDVLWHTIAKPIRGSHCFDTALHFQYSLKEADDLVSETMSIQGSCFMATREKYWELMLCDEAFGSWGQQGVEVACKTWLSGGRVLSTKKAYYGHQFRETEGFPYPNPSDRILAAQDYSRNLFLKNRWHLQKYPIQWLIEKFGYEADWTPALVNELCAPWPVDKNA